MRSGSAKGMALEPAQKDPDDPTHLTIAFTVKSWSDHKGFIDVYLRNDDSLRFVVHENIELPKYGRIRPGEFIMTGMAK